MNYIYQFHETDLASRTSGSRVRETLRRLVDEHGSVTLDFSLVLSVAESYGDELFGVLALENGLDWLFSHIHVVNATPAVARSLARAVSRRLETSKAAADNFSIVKKALTLKAPSLARPAAASPTMLSA